MDNNKAVVVSIKELFDGYNLIIPPYQRPYKWEIHNTNELLDDISKAIEDYKKYGETFKYRIGTILLQKPDIKNEYNIVDGQQRIITLSLLLHFLGIAQSHSNSIFKTKFSSKISQYNIHCNYNLIKEWFAFNIDKKEAFIRALENLLEVVIIQVKKTSEAFQLFDSQNNRGKALAPQDLLKAYHLREMINTPYEMEHAVTKWESQNTKDISELFDLYLYPIWNWSRGWKSKDFTTKNIDTYKGISDKSEYSYAKRARKAMPYFQITEPFISGSDFFDMVDHYLNMINDIRKELERNESFTKINEILNTKEHSAGFNHAKNLFNCALLMYYDKFHNFDQMAVKKLFIWSFMIRVDMQNLGYDTINKYAIGEYNDRYTNVIPIFSKISLSRKHTELTTLQVKTLRPNDMPENSNWEKLYVLLKEICRNDEVQYG